MSAELLAPPWDKTTSAARSNTGAADVVCGRIRKLLDPPPRDVVGFDVLEADVLAELRRMRAECGVQSLGTGL